MTTPRLDGHHGLASARYLRYKDEAQPRPSRTATARPRRVDRHGRLPARARRRDGDGFAGVKPVAQPGRPTPHSTVPGRRPGQVGDRYICGAEVKNLDEAAPAAFDCSALTQWAAHQAGVTIPDGAAGQYRYFQKMGLLVPVEEAKNTPGALLFHFASDPVGGKGEPPVAHVAISTGDGKTIEARNSRAGV